MPLAAATARFVRHEAWCEFGFARLSDHARERFGRCGRWVRDMATLGAAIESLPGLGRAVSGDDGGRPLDRTAAVLVARVATAETLLWWIAQARRLSIEALRRAVLQARQSDGLHDEPAARQVVKFLVPVPVKVAFAEALDLFRAVEGGEAPVVSFIEALVAEGAVGSGAFDAGAAVSVEAAVEGEVAAPRPSRQATDLPDASGEWALHLAGVTLARLGLLCDEAGSGGPFDLDRQIRGLLALEDELERRLGDLLAAMGDDAAWSRLGFDGAGHYASARLKMSRTVAEDRLRAARGLRRLTWVRQAYEAGEVALEPVMHIIRLLRCGEADEATQRAWVERARGATVKRVRDEVRELWRRRVFDGDAEHRHPLDIPLDDSAWHASLRREPGATRERVSRLAALAMEHPVPDIFLRLRLPADTARALMAAVESRREGLAPWVGLMALLAEFVATWDPPASGVKRRSEKIYIRAGYRCMAPGCLSRRNLEDHHLVYRSRGGGNEPANRECLCRFHHQRGEHGGLSRCRGRAPLGVVWRIGRGGGATWWRNELRVR